MTESSNPQTSEAVPVQTTAATDFANDIGPKNIRESFTLYLQRVRSGEVGALPALIGVVLLAIIFQSANSLFLSEANFANFLTQAAPVAILAMGTVFVLLLGEIDLSVGTAMGVCASVMALGMNNDGDLQSVLGTGVYLGLLAFMLATAIISVIYKLWLATAFIVVGGILMVTGGTSSQLLAMFVSISIGVAIGTFIGYLVAHVGIPSFVVTLALFLAWQGILLAFIGQGSAIPTRNFDLIFSIENKYLAVTLGWILWAVAIAGYGGFTIFRSIRRRSAKLSGEPIDLVLVRLAALTITTGLAVFVLSQNRSKTVFAELKGMPYVVPVLVILLVLWTYVLAKTRYGRYVYAVGGNTEAARRAGIDVKRIRLSVFIVSSGMAGLAAIVLASKNGGVPSDFGGGTTQLYAVGAAVIGGASLFGGRGKVRDGLIGALVIAMIPNGLGLIGLGSKVEFVVTALVLLLAASVDAISRRRVAK